MANNTTINASKRRGCIALAIAMGAPFLLFAQGCALKLPARQPDAWINGYQPAETNASDRGTGMIICYHNTPPNRLDQMLKTTRDAIAVDSKSNYVGCVLAKTYAWDRKYVAQFGVDRSPALIVLHPDGTFHSHVGFLNFGGIQEFLAGADPPGTAPQWNPFLHRNPRYAWLSSTEEAEAIAKESNRSMLIVFYRRWSKDLRSIKRMLRKPAVYRRFSEMVHVRSSRFWSYSEVLDTQYGTLELPAIVIARPDGTYRVLEVPRSYDAIIRFADNTEGKNESYETDSPTVGPPAATTVLGSD